MARKSSPSASPSAGIVPAPAPSPAPARPALPEPEFGFSPPDHYDPEDYRWVPVRRIPRRDGWTEEKQRRFIEVLADTGLVGMAAKEVGMSRAAAYKLRRAPHAAAFARAWDVARERAGALIEDIAFERALQGVETEVYDRYGQLTGSRTVYNDRLLTFLLRHLKPARYGTVTQMRGDAAPAKAERAAPPDDAAPALTLDDALRAMEPVLPEPAEALLGPEGLEDALLTAEIADGALPQFDAEQAPAKSDRQRRAEALTERYERGRRLYEELGDGAPPITSEEFDDWCLYLDPARASEPARKNKPAR